MSKRVFIVGAGFNADAHLDSRTDGTLKYPLLPNLLKECFGLTELPPGKSVEDLFQDALDRSETEQTERLVALLMKADQHLPPRLDDSEHWESSPYVKFLKTFPEDEIINFNYDGLLEIIALQLRQWRPEDGFGVPVEVGPGMGQDAYPLSARHILHPHGSLYVMVQEARIIPQGLGKRVDLLEPRENPAFFFQPHTLAQRFTPFTRAGLPIPFSRPHERIVAPVPSKATGAGRRWGSMIQRCAARAIAEASQVVAIGYSFAEADAETYARLLRAHGEREVLLVMPDAQQVARRMQRASPQIRWRWLEGCWTFREWVYAGFPGIK